ncbi:MAG: copper chaperone PCu(A)C [Gemmatimonadales bacterium]|nr:copper chaperone PCu(A)C [Gemmatimonadales bacterium]
MSRAAPRVGFALALLVGTGMLSCGPERGHDAAADTVAVRVGDLVIYDGYVAAPVVEHVTMAFVTIENIGTESDALVGASTDLADRVRLHSQVLDGPLGRSSPVNRITIEPGRALVLEAGGYHLTLEDLRVQLAPGDSVTLRLRFERAGTANVRLPVLSHLELVHNPSPLAGDTEG